ncbi:MAG: HAD family phosphatase [Candidatus Nomurabacteria bacterium]|nr:MAG: HAD family phosphatase [Candidatus Nomurabacteria bacterium]HRV75994.1 HAD family phosphatase [Candidatus Saccharimonadales bacterium]
MSKKFAVFDIDGTLIRWQLYHALVDRLAKKGYLGEGVYEKIQEARMDWKVRNNEDGFYRYEIKLIEAFEDTVEGLEEKVFLEIVEDVFEQYKDQVYIYTRELIKDLKYKDYFLIFISGSHNELVQKLADYYGFDDFVGTHYAREGSKLKKDVFVASHHKKDLLKNFIKKHNLSYEDSYAVGDTSSDAPMLEIVENAIAFNPDKKLYELAKANNWKIVVERKNVVYEI